MGTNDLMGVRKTSVNKRTKDRNEDNNSIGTDYSDDDMKDIEYNQRNKELYKVLKRIGVCVIPDPRIKTADHLPYFAIIQDDIREKNKDSTRENTRREQRSSRKGNSENRDFDISHFKSIDFFSFLNSQAMMKNKKTKKSPSLQKYHKNSKYAGLVGAMGQKEEKEILEKINIISKENEEKRKEGAQEKVLINLFASSNTGTRPLGHLPDTQDSVKIAMNRGIKKSINNNKFLKNSLGDNSLLDRKFLGNEVSFDRGVTGLQPTSGASNENNEMRTFMIEQLQNDKFKKRKPKQDNYTSKTVSVTMSKNKKLNAAYTKEKRKLELEMLKLNEKLGTTAKILNLIRYEKSPTPLYKFKDFKEKIALLKKYKDSKKFKNKMKGRKGLDTLLLGDKKEGTKNYRKDGSPHSSIIEDYEPTESDSNSF